MNNRLCCYGTFKNCVRCNSCIDDVECKLEKRSKEEENKNNEQGEHNR